VLTTEQLQDVTGCDAVGLDGSKIGKVGQVYLDDVTGQPEWVTVSTGLFGSRETFIPLARAEFRDGVLRVPYDKNRVKDAPNIDVDGQLSEQEEDELYRYYGLPAEATVTSETPDSSAAGQDTSGSTTDEAMTRSEERVQVGKQARESGRARLRKYVVTTEEQVSVPVTREQVRIEREPITDANRGAAMSGPELSEEEHEVVLTEERPVIQKETVPVERVRLSKDQVHEEETVNVDVREERIETDVDDSTGQR
jgi:uncharacterized protein (TIGR02271 family)